MLAIIDIDGNTWSARFNSLLCSNSVVIKVQPDFVEQSYKELEPFVHYVPATINNITKAAEYVLDWRHKAEVQQIIKNANDWCASFMTANALASAAVISLQHYTELLSKYDSRWTSKAKSMFLDADDLVPCHAYSLSDS